MEMGFENLSSYSEWFFGEAFSANHLGHHNPFRLLGDVHLATLHNLHVINGNKTFWINLVNQLKDIFDIFTGHDRSE